MFDVVPYDDIIRQGIVGSKKKSASIYMRRIDDCLLEYQRMADALAQVSKSTGTQFVYSLCEWGWVSLQSLFVYFDWLLKAI
jgi:alpha-galactosidase